MENLNNSYNPTQNPVEKEIQTELQRFMELFLNAPSIIAITKGEEHTFKWANQNYIQLVGNKNVIGKTVSEVQPELEDQGFIEVLDNIYTTGQSFSAKEMLMKIDIGANDILADNYLNLVYKPYKNIEGEIEGIFLFANNITEQVQARKKVEESEKLYRQIIETAEGGIWMIDKNNETTFVNEKLSEILGYPHAEMIGKKNIFFMDEEGKKIASHAAINRIPGRSERVDIPLIKKNGQKVWVTLSGSSLMDEKGQYNGGLAMVMDITERKIAEEKLMQSEERFRALIENTHDAI